MPRRAGFTLIELLVVVTIIAVLAALLAPALERAVYQAELAVCGARLKAIGTGVLIYAPDFRRAYPHRPSMDYKSAANSTARPTDLTFPEPGGFDDRTSLGGYLDVSLLVCPLVRKVDLSTAVDSYRVTSYARWYGWRWAGERAMARLGDRFTLGSSSFNVLAADADAAGRAATGFRPLIPMRTG